MADAVLHQGVCGVTDLMIKPGLINLDFADIRAVMSEMGKAMMGTGEASGETRAIEAAESAINNPLLDDSSMKGAKAVLINITGGMDMTLFEVDEAANRIREEVDPDATIIFGSAFEEKLEGVMRVSVVATGIDALSINTPLPLQGTANTDSAGASNEAISPEKVKQVINFGHLAPASFIPPKYDLSDTEDTKNTPEEVDPQCTQTASLEQQMKPEQHPVGAADDPESCRLKKEDNNICLLYTSPSPRD